MKHLGALRRALLAIGVLLVACNGSSKPARPCDVFDTTHCIDATRMYADVTELASARYAGRRAGTEGNAAAVALAEARLAAALEPAPGASGYLQGFSFDQWVPTAAALSLDGAAVPLGSGYDVVWYSAAGTVTDAPVVFVGYGLRVPAFDRNAYPDCPFPAAGYDEYGGVEVVGRIVVALRGYPGPAGACPPDPSFCAATDTTGCFARLSYKSRVAQAQGAAGLLLVAPYAASGEPVPFTTTGTLTPLVPTLLVDRATLELALPGLPGWAAQIDGTTFEGRRPASVETEVRASMTVDGGFQPAAASNVVGIVPGADPILKDEVVVIGAHLDHMGKLPLRQAFYPGADDNASGTAVVLELARAVAASPTRPKRTLVFALWNAEELGLIGSCHYVYVDPLLPLASTVAAFSVDMVGAGDPGLELWGGEGAPWMPQLVESGRAALGVKASWPVYARPDLTASDHACFLDQGIPAFLASTPEILSHPTYHTLDDVAAGVSAENLESSAKLLWAGVHALAMGAEASAPAANPSQATTTAAPAPLRPERFGPGLVAE